MSGDIQFGLSSGRLRTMGGNCVCQGSAKNSFSPLSPLLPLRVTLTLDDRRTLDLRYVNLARSNLCTNDS